MQAQGENPPPAQHLARPGANPPFTVANTMCKSGINIPTLFQGDSQAERISGEVFDDEFMACMDKTVKELDDDLKSSLNFTAANGQIRLNLAQKKC